MHKRSSFQVVFKASVYFAVVNQYHFTGFFLYLLKTSVNFWGFFVIRGHRKRPMA